MTGGQKIRCKRCNEVVQSMHRHDMKWCSCRLIGIDGGSDYTRICYGPDWKSNGECYELIDSDLEEKKYTKGQIEAAVRYAVKSAQAKVESQQAGMWYILDANALWSYLKDI